ncbi:hypothetical protein Q5P01_007231 [Channa striata]|uniref:Uncharacterized protein n=1 Tax=Channa striata TaxID=64152 RepID=A0AA88N3J5_CHASR|nr:hypothetical protein Q5P01_007231 [Channa striata]
MQVKRTAVTLYFIVCSRLQAAVRTDRADHRDPGHTPEDHGQRRTYELDSEREKEGAATHSRLHPGKRKKARQRTKRQPRA